MSALEIARLAVKIAGIGVWLIALDHIAEVLPLFDSLAFADDDSQIGWFASAGTIVLSVLGALLFFGGDAVARFVAKGATRGLEQQDTVAERQAIAFSIVGLWILSMFAVELLSASLIFSMDPFSDGTKEFAIANFRMAALPLLAKVSLGVWLFLGSAGVVRLYRRFQSMGLQRSETHPARQFDVRVTQWHAISFSIVGVVLFVKALSGAVSLAGLISMYARIDSDLVSMPPMFEPFIVCFLYLIFGLFVFVRAQRIANWWARLR